MKTHGTNLFEYLRGTKPSPCEPAKKDGDRCPHYDRCATKKLACSAYAKYLSRDRGRVYWKGEVPNRRIFIQAEADHEPGGTLTAYCRKHGLTYHNMKKRIDAGMSRDEARMDIVGRAA